MVRRFSTLFVLAVVAVFGSLLTAGTTRAAQGSWYSGTDGYGRYNSFSGVSTPRSYSGYSGYSTPSYSTVPTDPRPVPTYTHPAPRNTATFPIYSPTPLIYYTPRW